LLVFCDPFLLSSPLLSTVLSRKSILLRNVHESYARKIIEVRTASLPGKVQQSSFLMMARFGRFVLYLSVSRFLLLVALWFPRYRDQGTGGLSPHTRRAPLITSLV